MVEWSSPLGLAAVLFALAGLFHVFIGVATPLSIRQGWVPSILIYNEEADRVIFGKPPQELRQHADVMKLREITLGMVSGLLVGVGSLEVALVWYGVRAGAAWSVGALAGAEVLMVVFWGFGHRLWIEAGLPGGLGALQPFQWVPLALSLPATALAWLGLRG
ncbi:MAG TPA: hypothetical protein VGR28_11010 [Candidatus Thermoplasmatota archaeon]|jgi:hypothetical protein|nr:hypothetical protein [Candidatus Thermoplasmatota archaeon]